MIALRTCTKCGLEANLFSDLENFKRNKNSKHGHENLCKPCHQKHKHPHRKDLKNISQQKFLDKNPNYMKEYRERKKLEKWRNF